MRYSNRQNLVLGQKTPIFALQLKIADVNFAPKPASLEVIHE
jgi:hypothetical protein